MTDLFESVAEDIGVTQKKKPVPSAPDSFDLWYTHYPRKEARGRAVKAWAKAIRKAFPDQLIEAIKLYAEKVKGKEREFIPLPATWLNDERWLDETPSPETVTKKTQSRHESVAWCVKRRMHTTTISHIDVLAAFKAGFLTEEEIRAYGVRP